MTKQADQPIKPHSQPDPSWHDSLDEMTALLETCTFELAMRGRPIPPADFCRVVDAAEKYQKAHPEVQDRQAVTMACTAYWKMLERRG